MAAGPQSLVKKDLKSGKSETQKLFQRKLSQHHAVGTRAELDGSSIIRNAEGKPVFYFQDNDALIYGDPAESYGNISTIVYGENNDVYFYNIAPELGTTTYVKGTQEGDVITVELPQVLEFYDAYGYGMALTLQKLNAITGAYVAAEGSVQFNVYDDGDIVLELPGEETGDYALGVIYTDDLSDIGLSYLSMVYSPMEEQPVVTPEGIETETYYFNDGYFGYPVKVGMDSQHIYLQGIVEGMPSFTTIYGDLNGNQASLPQDQFLGGYYGYEIYTKCIELIGGQYDFSPESATVNLNIDTANKTISYSENSPLLYIIADLQQRLGLALYEEFNLKVQDSFSGTPRNPYNLDYNDDYIDYGYYSFMFNISNVSTEGNVLNNEDLYYKVYIDGDVFEFEEEFDDDLGYNIYDGFGTGELVPFYFDNGNDFYSWSVNQREVGIYIEGVSTIGVQTIYDYNGQVTESGIVTFNTETGEVDSTPSGVEGLINNEVKSVMYYDLNGRRIANPEQGIFIKKSVNNDGKVSTKKVVVR